MIGIGTFVVEALLRPHRVAHGHTGNHSYATVEIRRDEIKGAVQFPIDQLNEVLGTSIPLDEAGALASIEAERPKIEAYIRDHFVIADGDRAWPVVLQDVRAMQRRRFSYAIFEYRIEPPPAPIPTHFTVSFDAIVHANTHAEAMTIIRRPAGIGPVQVSNEQQFLATAAGGTHDVTIPPSSWRQDLAGAATKIVGSADEAVRRTLKRFGVGRSRRRRTM